MKNQARYYEQVGDTLKGAETEKAYRAAQNHLQPSDQNYMTDVKRLQAKIIKALEQQG